MKTEIMVDNLKCGNSAKTIIKNILTFDNITDVNVINEEEKIIITHQDSIDLTKIKTKLNSIGYPIKNENNYLNKITCNIKSYVSCTIDKMSDNDLKNDINHVAI